MRYTLTCGFLTILVLSVNDPDLKWVWVWDEAFETDFCKYCDGSSTSSVEIPFELSVSSVFDLLPQEALFTGTIL